MRLFLAVFFIVLGSLTIRISSHAQPSKRFWIAVAPGSTAKPQVTTIQYLLRAHGYQLAVDGVFGAQTKARVQRFQIKNELNETGIVDPATWEKLVITVKRGNKGDAVRAAQTMLRGYWKDFDNPDYRKVVVNGVYGVEMERLIKKFQKKDPELKISDGIIGKDSWAILTACEH